MGSTRFVTTVIVVAILAAACSSAVEEPDVSSTTPTTVPLTTIALAAVPVDYAGYLAQPTACGAHQPDPVEPMQFDGPGDVSVEPGMTVTLTTSCGPIEIAVDPEAAPETVRSFVFLAEQGFFDGTVSHRVIPGFMMQAGDPTATGSGDPGYAIPDEFPTGDNPYRRGVVAMANSGPGTSGSQFFILFGDADWLPPQYSVFGEVVDGFDTLDAIEQIPLARSPRGSDPSPSVPLETIFIESVDIDR